MQHQIPDDLLSNLPEDKALGLAEIRADLHRLLAATQDLTDEQKALLTSYNIKATGKP